MPEQIRDMTPAELFAAIDGYNKAHSSKEDFETDLTEAEYIRVLSEEKMAGRA